jgi:hypothetical protein
MWNLIAGAIIGTVTSILTSGGVAILVEYMRKPRLKVSIERPPLEQTYSPGAPAREARLLRVAVYNEPLPVWAKWMVRAPALQCRATITFHHLDGRNYFGRAMGGRWAGSPEPVALPVVGPEGQQFQILDFTRLSLESRIDIYPGQTEILDIANRPDNDDECYGWNNETYFSNPRWRNPNWRLPSGRYLVRVIISSSGQEFTNYFHLMNNVPRRDFRLEPASRAEIDLVIRGLRVAEA